MGTPLYTTDIIPMTSRPTLTVMDDGDYFVILDTSTGKISKILKTNIMTALKITYDNTSGLTAETVQAALDELVINLGSSDSAILALAGRLGTLEGTGYTEGSLKTHEDRLDTLEGTGAGSVAKAIDDAVSPIEENKADKATTYTKTEVDATIDALDTRLDTIEGTGEGSVADDIAKYAVKLTKMPDGATAVYSQDAWETVDGWGLTANGSLIVGDGVLRFTASATSSRWFGKSIANIAGKIIAIRYQSSVVGTFQVNNGTTSVKALPIASTPTIQIIQIPAYLLNEIVYFSIGDGIVGDIFNIDWIWIGDYSYLSNSLSTEASRIATQLGDTAGVGTKASGTITSNGTNVSDGDTVTIARKVYTFKAILGTTEGNVLIGGTSAESLDNLKLAINSTGVTAEQYCATFHPLVEATTNTDTMQTLVARSVGLLGNSITLAKSASTLTISGSTLTGGTDDVGQKIYTQVKDIVAGGTRPAQADISDTSTIVGYENSVDVASGRTTKLPAGGTFRWAVYGYGATIASAKNGTSAGGTTLTVAGANATVWYRRIA